MKKLTLLMIIAVGFAAGSLVAEPTDYARISFIGPGTGKSEIPKNELIVLVLEGAFFTHDQTPIPTDGLVDYINQTLNAQGASYLAVHVRDGVKYGDVVSSLDQLRKTAAKNIGVSMIALPAGRNP